MDDVIQKPQDPVSQPLLGAQQKTEEVLSPSGNTYEQQLDIYTKAGLPKKAILQKIEQDFGLEGKYKAEEALNIKYAPKKARSKYLVLVLMFAIAVFILLISYFLISSVLESPDFNSSKCPGVGKITVSGSQDFRDKIFASLSLVESKNCSYLGFISANYPLISATTTQVSSTSLYDNLKHSIAPDFSGSSFFVANAIIHEACHSYQVKLNLPQDEHNCTLTQYDFLMGMGSPSDDIQKIIDLKNNPDYSFNETNTDVFALWLRNGGN